MFLDYAGANVTDDLPAEPADKAKYKELFGPDANAAESTEGGSMEAGLFVL